MFRKLVSNLPFSPSLINQVGFYSKRLKKEDMPRRVGLIFTALAIVVQSFTFLAPAKATLAASLNDIVYGGGDRSSLVKALSSGCDSKKRCDLKAIFSAYGINATNLASAKDVTITSTAANNYWSLGRSPRGYGGEVSKSIPGGPTVYSRTLHGWAANKNWSALQVSTSQGTRWILKECGNIVTKEGAPAQPVQPPDVTITKTVSKAKVKRGEKFYYDLKITNIGKGTAKDVPIYDTTVPGLELQPDGLSTDPLVTVMRWQTKSKHTIAPGQIMKYRLYAIARSNGPATLINKACVDIIDANVYNNCDQVPVTVIEPCPLPGKESLAKDDPQCKSNPAITVEKTADKGSVKVGDTFIYTLKTTNKGDVDLTKTAFSDKAPSQIEFLEVKEPGESNFKALTNKREYTSKVFSLGKGKTVTAQIKARAIASSTSQVLNTVCVIATNPQSNATTGTCDDVPVTITTPQKPQTEYCPYPGKQSLPKDSPLCKPDVPQQPELCTVPGKENLPKNDPNCKEDPKPEMCTVPGKENLPKNDPKCKPDCTLNPSISYDDPRCTPCPIEGKTNLPKNSPDCKPCDETKKNADGKDISCLELRKKARNITKQIADANGTKASAGDTIEYTLSVRNLSKEARTGFVIEENMEDVLEYADILDASGATFTENPVKMLSWSGVTIKPGETVSRTILIKVKSNIPNTPSSTSDPLSYDMQMVNVYGDTVRIDLPKTPIKTVEQTVTKLPSTGFGTNVVVSTILLMAATYFYFRNRTMVKELSLIKQQFNYAAGV